MGEQPAPPNPGGRPPPASKVTIGIPRNVLIAAGAVLLIAAIAVTIMVTTSGGGGDRYPAAAEHRLISSCEFKGSPANLCECIVARLEERVSYEELIAEGISLEEGGKPGSAIYEAVLKCAS